MNFTGTISIIKISLTLSKCFVKTEKKKQNIYSLEFCKMEQLPINVCFENDSLLTLYYVHGF